ncbi:hypothetical protein Y032_0553g3359 [Ancylostoma ceylanicum]|uniref:Uncharacterized protein n=1 Tax=Ancylostoma ceylanicum TaxID=53326 RepID=A0A016WQB0_9BILA|nr:hypothetical protein Y032_0553g3359 [Ancylostoma ceylanicum]
MIASLAAAPSTRRGRGPTFTRRVDVAAAGVPIVIDVPRMYRLIGHSKRSESWCIHRVKAGGAVMYYQACLILIENDRISVRDPSTNSHYRLNGM